MSSPIPVTGGKASGIFSWRNAQACLSLRLSVACPPPNSTISLISCSSFSMRCAHTRVWLSELSLAVPTTTGTCLALGTLHTHFRVSRSISTTTATCSSNFVDPSTWTSYSAVFRRRDSSISLTATSYLTTFSWTGRRLRLSSTGRLLVITPSSGSIVECMIRDGWRLHGDVFSLAFSQVRVGRRRSGLYLESFVISVSIILTLDSVWGFLGWGILPFVVLKMRTKISPTGPNVADFCDGFRFILNKYQ